MNCLAEVGEHIWPIVEVDHGNPAVDVNFVSVVGAGAPILMGNSIVVTAAVALTAHGTQEFLLKTIVLNGFNSKNYLPLTERPRALEILECARLGRLACTIGWCPGPPASHPTALGCPCSGKRRRAGQ
jgi:hypothetical protein